MKSFLTVLAVTVAATPALASDIQAISRAYDGAVIAWADCGNPNQACAYSIDLETGELGAQRDDYTVPGIANGVPDQRPAIGTGRIQAAWLEDPTSDYPHAALGDPIEGQTVAVKLDDGSISRYRLPGGIVFEDLTPRLFDWNGDGLDEVTVITAQDRVGAALLALTVDGSDLRPLAESAPIGRGYRWLNPLGAADFDGDGQIELAYVETPHIGGTLRILGLDGDLLAEEANWRGVSNHAMGALAQHLGDVVTLDGGQPAMFLPLMGRQTVVLLGMAEGELTQLGELDLADRATLGLICEPCSSPVTLYALNHRGDLTVVEPGW